MTIDLNTPPTICKSSGQAGQLLRQATNDLANLRPTYAPELKRVDARIADLLPRATVDPARKPELQEAISERDGLLAAERTLSEQRQELTKQVEHYQQEENRLAHEERIHAANEATTELLQAVTAFKLAAAEACRRYDRVLATQRRNQGVPGAQTALPPKLDFHFAFMLPDMWQGTVSNMIQQGGLPWLNDEKKREQQLREAA